MNKFTKYMFFSFQLCKRFLFRYLTITEISEMSVLNNLVVSAVIMTIPLFFTHLPASTYLKSIKYCSSLERKEGGVCRILVLHCLDL